MKRLIFLPLLLAMACATSNALMPFDEAENASMSRDQRHVLALVASAAISDPDPRRRDQACIRAARLEWHVLRDADAARAWLAKVSDGSREAFAAHIERSLLECMLVRDFAAARRAAEEARDAARIRSERDDALTRAADAAVEEARLEREAGQCPAQPPLKSAIASLRDAIEGSGPTVERTRLLLDAAILGHDADTMMQAWRWYYGDLPILVPPSIGDRRTRALALAHARLFAEAGMVLRDPCEPAAPFDDPQLRDVLAYADAMHRVGALAAEHHRAVAAGTASDDAFTRDLMSVGASLWKALSWPGDVPPFSPEALQDELSRRFGAVITLGRTDGIFGLLYGHRVADEERAVEQYGHSASLHFIELDGMISGGFASWLTRDEIGTGGWSSGNTIVQIRPMYANGPLHLWQSTADPTERARADEKIREESSRDLQRARGDAIVALPGLALRLRQQYVDRLRERLTAEGLQGDALRDAFIREAAADELASSIWAHEGRHAIDKSLGVTDSTELEFRAKLSEVTFAPAPRIALGSILAPIGRGAGHPAANERVLRGVAAWMRGHAAAIAGFDAGLPTLPQLDRLTDDQLRDAFRSLDPLAP